ATARGSLPPTPPRYSPYESVVSQLKQYRVTDLRSATSASAGLDLAVATVVLNTPKEIKVVSTGIWGGLPKGLVGILVLTGIIDSDYQGDLKMMIIILFAMGRDLNHGKVKFIVAVIDIKPPAQTEMVNRKTSLG
uniref:dUTPase-like domain-containing protein n=1 Tax=Accipiter nisus TaxID=211598 RepID=A0A8B9NJI3_9AVES